MIDVACLGVAICVHDGFCCYSDISSLKVVSSVCLRVLCRPPTAIATAEEQRAEVAKIRGFVRAHAVVGWKKCPTLFPHTFPTHQRKDMSKFTYIIAIGTNLRAHTMRLQVPRFAFRQSD